MGRYGKISKALSRLVLLVVILNPPRLEGKKAKEAPTEDHQIQPSDPGSGGSYGVSDSLGAESGGASNGGVSSFNKYEKYGKYDMGETSVSDSMQSTAQYPETVMGYYSPYYGYTQSQSMNAYSYPNGYNYDADNSFYHKSGVTSSSSSSAQYPYSTDSYYKRNQKYSNREAQNRADGPEYLPAAGAPPRQQQQQQQSYAYPDNMYSLDEPAPGPGPAPGVGSAQSPYGNMHSSRPGPSAQSPSGPAYSQPHPMYSQGPMYPPPSGPGPMYAQEPATGLSSLGSSIMSGIGSMFGASSGPAPSFMPIPGPGGPGGPGPAYEFGGMPMESGHRSHYGGGGGWGWGGGWGHKHQHHGKKHYIEKKVQYVPAQYTKAIDNGIGLLGLLSLLSLLQANMFQFGTTTNSTRIVSFGNTGVTTGRKKRSLFDNGVDGEGHDGGFAKAQAIALQVLPALNVIAKVRQGSIPLECVYQEVCTVNRVLVAELALPGRHVGTVLSTGINRLMKSGNSSPILEEKLRRAGLAGRNMKKCHKVYPTCPALRQGGAASVPLLIQPDKIKLDMFENVDMSSVKNAQKKPQSRTVRYKQAPPTKNPFQARSN